MGEPSDTGTSEPRSRGAETFGRYRLLDRLGEGGMAEVFKAKSFGVEGFEKTLVIKRILPKLALKARFVDMFVHEAKLAVRLSHANIVQVFDLGRAQAPGDEAPSYYIAMEYVAGLDLASVLSRARRAKAAVPLGLAVYVASEVAKALDHAHRRRDEQGRPLGVVHRDISPHNVLVSWEGEVKVTDFGIAKARDSLDAEAADSGGTVRGKLSYMSPEQSIASAVDARSDLFSLGTVVYEMIAGTHPFSAPTAFETARRLQASEYPPLEILRPDCPKVLCEVVARLLFKDPDARFPDAAHVHESLLAYFYASGDRFGAQQLAEFLEAFRDGLAAPEVTSAAVLDEQTGANERTPVEVPGGVASGRTGGQGRLRTPLGEGSDVGLPRVEFGQRREVTALVMSFSGAVRGSAVLPVQEGEAVAGPNGVRRSQREDVLERYGGRVIERDTTHVVALFGLGDPDGRDTHSAVRAALVTARARGAAMVSAGVHVARVVVDAQGEVVRDERLTSLVATAQSLAHAVDGQVAVSAIAARLVRAEFSMEEITDPSRKAPEGARVVSSRAPAAAASRFVGRHDELKRFGDILAAATRKRPQFVSLAGDEGIGKTRLVFEMERRLAKGSYNVGYYVAACPRNGADVPWSGLTAMLQALTGVQEWDDHDKVREIVPRLRALGLDDDEARAIVAHLGASVEGGDAKAHADRPRSSSHSRLDHEGALRTGFARMVQSLAEDRLQVFAWDDAHALDASSAQAIAYAIERGLARGAGLRAVFLFAKRGPPLASFVSDVAYHAVALGELSEDDASRLVAHRLGARMLPDALLALCRERAGGHPLFLEELLRDLGDSGAVTVLNGEVRTKLEGATAAPRTLRALIAGRVSRLQVDQRATLQAAAILGDPVLLPVLAAMLGQTVPQLDRLVAALAARDLMRASGPAEAAFASPMVGEIVLDAILPEARRELHATAAAAYVSSVGDVDEHAERVGDHLHEAGERDRAATCFVRAAHARLRLDQLELGARWLVRALDLADVDARTPEELTSWLTSLADAVSRVRAAPPLGEVLARALRRIDSIGATEQRAIARVEAARAQSSVNVFAEAYKRLDEAQTLAAERDDLRARVLVVEIDTATRAGDFTRATRAAARLEAIGPIDDPRTLIIIALARATTLGSASALASIDQASRLEGALDVAADREKMRVLVHMYLRDFKSAIEASPRAVDLARSLGVGYGVAVVLHNLGDATRRLGDFPRAYASFAESRDICEAGGHERLARLNRAHLAYLDGLAGVAAAEGVLRELIAYHEAHRFHTDALESRVLLGALLRHRGKPLEARRQLEEVLERAIDVGNRLIAEDAREELARILAGT